MIKRFILKVPNFKFRIRNKLFRSRFGQCGNNLFNVTISQDVKIMAGSYNLDNFILSGNRNHIDRGVIIDAYTWIGIGVIILDVRIIEKYNIIGAGTVVTHDIVDNYSIYAGNPAKHIRSIKKKTKLIKSDRR